MSERWRDVDHFFKIQVSDHGNVRNVFTGKTICQSENMAGDLKINIIVDGRHLSRSVKELVAEAFLDPPEELYIDESGNLVHTHPVPINIDGNKYNNHVSNLAWRPRWFAWKYAHQFNVEPPQDYYLPLINMTTGERFINTMEAGLAEGLLWEYVIASASSGRPVYPSGSVFAFDYGAIE